MERLVRFHWLVLLAAGLAGCGQPSEQPAATDSAKPSLSAAAPAPPRTAMEKAVAPPHAVTEATPKLKPEQVVHQFLEAVRTGNDEQAAAMLTEIARQKTEEENLVVAPPGSDTAKFEVGQVELDAEGGACVEAVWTDLDENGQPQSDRVLWMLRQEPQGWRIAGVAAPIFEGEPPLLLNFEDPEDMLRKQQEVREEIQRRLAADAPQVSPPATTESPVTPPIEEAQQPARFENPMRR